MYRWPIENPQRDGRFVRHGWADATYVIGGRNHNIVCFAIFSVFLKRELWHLRFMRRPEDGMTNRGSSEARGQSLGGYPNRSR